MKNIRIKSSTGVKFYMTREGFTNFHGLLFIICISKKGDKLFLKYHNYEFSWVDNPPPSPLVHGTTFSRKDISDIIRNLIYDDFRIKD